MQATSFDRSGFAHIAVVSLVTFAALALLGVVLAYWTWNWLAPRAEPQAQSARYTAGGLQAVAGLFGGAQTQRDIAAPADHAVLLLGVVADSGSPSGYAVLRLDAKQTVAVREGGEIGPGVRLAEVHADHVVMERRGVREKLALPEQGKSADLTALPASR